MADSRYLYSTFSLLAITKRSSWSCEI